MHRKFVMRIGGFIAWAKLDPFNIKVASTCNFVGCASKCLIRWMLFFSDGFNCDILCPKYFVYGISIFVSSKGFYSKDCNNVLTSAKYLWLICF